MRHGGFLVRICEQYGPGIGMVSCGAGALSMPLASVHPAFANASGSMAVIFSMIHTSLLSKVCVQVASLCVIACAIQVSSAVRKPGCSPKNTQTCVNAGLPYGFGSVKMTGCPAAISLCTTATSCDGCPL